MRMRVLTAGLVLMLAGSAWAQEQPAKETQTQPSKEVKKQEEKKSLKIGDKAPPLVIEKWVKGEPVTGFEKGKVYVVEFWATWCGPCVKMFPHLSELQKEYKDKGVTIIGTNIWEDRMEEYSDKTLDHVKEFVEKQGDKMSYTVAYDGAKKVMDKSYMAAASRPGIPSAFIVNQDGVVAFIGHPAEMDEPLKQIVEGKYDLKAAADKYAAQQVVDEVQREVGAAARSGDMDKAIKIVDESIAKNPKTARGLSVLKFQLLLMGVNDTDKAAAWAEEAADKHLTSKEDAEDINSMAWLLLENDADKKHTKTALRLAEKAVKFTDNKDGMILDTLALACFEDGQTQRAYDLQKKAVELIKDHPMANEQMVDEMNERLEKFEKALKDKK